MKKLVSIIRIAILVALSAFAVQLLFGEEQGDSGWTFFQMAIDKGLGIADFFLIGKLYARWLKVDPWLKAFGKMCDRVMEEPNPCCIEE